MDSFNKCASIVTGTFCQWFYRLGFLVASKPIPFIVLPLVVFSTLGVFFLYADHHSKVEDMYTPLNSRARDDRKRVKELFKDGTGDNFNQMSTNDYPLGVAIILQQRDKSNMLIESTLELLESIIDQIRNVTMVIDVNLVVSNTTETGWTSSLNMTPGSEVTSGNYLTLEDYQSQSNFTGTSEGIKVLKTRRLVTWEDVCARLDGSCQIEGSFLRSEEFKESYRNSTVTYPYWDCPSGFLDLSRSLGNVNVTDTGSVLSVGALRLIFYLRRDTEHLKHLSLEWEKQYLAAVTELDFGSLDIAYASSHSLGDELDRGTRADIRFFAVTFTLMIFYTSLVTAGGDCVSTRISLACGGVLAAVLGVFGSLGVVSLLGVPFVNMVGCMPFLVLGIGLDDMFLMMAAWSDTLSQDGLTVPERLGRAYRAAGIGVTITSLTDGLAFAVGAITSLFQSVTNFCIYTGTAVMICYVCNLTFFGGCMAFHGRRVYSSRHTITCRKIKSREELKEQGHTRPFMYCCGGSLPKKSDESVCEKGPRLILPCLVLWTPMKVVILLCFAGYLGLAVWGTFTLEQGLLLKHLVLPSSFNYKFITWDEEIFGVTFPISFVIDEPLDYANFSTAMKVREIFTKAREDPDINDIGTHCWLVDFFLSVHFDPSSKEAFVRSLRDKFLPENLQYMSDIVIDTTTDVITASRCHVLSENVRSSTSQADLMLRMRNVADAAPFKVFAFQPFFIYFEQYAAIVPNTLLTVGVAFVAIFIVSFVLLVHPLMVFLVLFNVVMIVTGIFGFMSFWGLTLSSVTMIHLIMSVGFSVDFSAHVCAAYMTSVERTRQGRTRYALVHASGPIFNGGLSSITGIAILFFSESYIFSSFFKIMFLVIFFGVIHAVFLMPVILSLIGPELTNEKTEPRNKSVAMTLSSDEMTANGKHQHNGTTSTVTLSTYQAVEYKRSLDTWREGRTAFDNDICAMHL